MGPCNTAIYRWCASEHHHWISGLICSIGIGSSNKIAVEIVWCSIWKAKVSNNVKMFAWKACHKVLPACANLFKRMYYEVDMMHILWICEEAQRIWCCSKEVIRAWIPRLCENILACIGGVRSNILILKKQK